MITRVATLLVLGLTFAGCGHRCEVASQCGRGEYCDFIEHECASQCRSDSDCSPTARCNTYGICDPIVRPKDASTSTTTADAHTSTTADAGAAD